MYNGDLFADRKNGVYHLLEEREALKKKLKDADKLLGQCLQQIKSLAEEKDRKDKELEEVKGAAQVQSLTSGSTRGRSRQQEDPIRASPWSPVENR